MSERNRRKFLEDSLFAAAAAASAGAVAPLVGRAQEQSDSPNERLRVAVVGLRGRGKSHLAAFMDRKDTEVAVVVDADEAVGRQTVADVLKKTGKKPVFHKDMRTAFEDKSIDAVSIATPNHWHALSAIWAIQAGKDVYLEKPVSHNVTEGRRIVQAARKHNKIVQTGTQCRSTEATSTAIAYVHDGKIGECKLARGLCYKPRGSIGPKGNYDVPASVDYELWTGPAELQTLSRPKLHYDWHWVWNTGNGDLGNQGIHQMDIGRWGLNVHNIGSRVLSYGGRLGYNDAGETANSQVSIHDFEDGKRLVFEVRGLKSKDLRGAKVGVIFYGTEGYVVMTGYNSGAAFDLDGNLTKRFSGGDDHFGNFVDAVRSRKRSDLTADIEEGHYSSALCHLGNISMRMGTAIPVADVEDRLDKNGESHETFERFASHLAENGVDVQKSSINFGLDLTIDPNKEVFVGEHAAAANPWLSREYRKGFVVPGEADV